MTNLCVRCGRPTPDGYCCSGCASELADALLVASGHAEDAEAVIARQTRYGAGSRGGSEARLGYDPTASARYAAVIRTVGRVGQDLTESGVRPPGPWRAAAGPLCAPQRPGDQPRDRRREEPWYRCEHTSCMAIRDRTPPTPLAAELMWLTQCMRNLRRHPAADEHFKDLHDACAELARLVDRPADKELVGMCDCGKVLYAANGNSVVTCPTPTCKLHWNVAESRNILRRSLDGKLVTAAEAARLSGFLDSDRTQDQIRKLINKWAQRGDLAAHGEIDGEPTFRFGDVFERLARTQRRAVREAA